MIDTLVYEINKQFETQLRQALDVYKEGWTYEDVINNGCIHYSQDGFHREVYMHDVLILEFDVNTELNEDKSKIVITYKM